MTNEPDSSPCGPNVTARDNVSAAEVDAPRDARDAPGVRPAMQKRGNGSAISAKQKGSASAVRCRLLMASSVRSVVQKTANSQRHGVVGGTNE